jgi:diguanylate cyclase
MRAVLWRGLEAAAAFAILGAAAFQLLQAEGDPGRQLLAIVSACTGLLGLAAGELAGARLHEAPPPPPEPEALLKEVMDRVLGGLEGYAENSQIYRADLEGIDRGLATMSDPARAREMIVDLRAANRRMEQNSARLNEELESSRAEIASLRDNVVEVERVALTDPLTEVGNRRFFDRTLKADMATCAAAGAELCLAFADIDRFKRVNDKFGHVVGDHLLKSFAELLTTGAKGRGRIARWGGEEFALLFPGVAFPEARRIVETLRRDIEARRWAVGPKQEPLGPVTASFGLAKLAPGESAESFINRADSRLMRAKQSGRNRVVAEDGAPTRAAS